MEGTPGWGQGINTRLMGADFSLELLGVVKFFFFSFQNWLNI